MKSANVSISSSHHYRKFMKKNSTKSGQKNLRDIFHVCQILQSDFQQLLAPARGAVLLSELLTSINENQRNGSPQRDGRPLVEFTAARHKHTASINTTQTDRGRFIAPQDNLIAHSVHSTKKKHA